VRNVNIRGESKIFPNFFLKMRMMEFLSSHYFSLLFDKVNFVEAEIVFFRFAADM
jgi:hypothetical protein